MPEKKVWCEVLEFTKEGLIQRVLACTEHENIALQDIVLWDVIKRYEKKGWKHRGGTTVGWVVPDSVTLGKILK